MTLCRGAPACWRDQLAAPDPSVGVISLPAPDTSVGVISLPAPDASVVVISCPHRPAGRRRRPYVPALRARRRRGPRRPPPLLAARRRGVRGAPATERRTVRP